MSIAGQVPRSDRYTRPMPARNRASIAALLVAVSVVDLAATRAFAAPPADGTAFQLASSTLASASQEAVRSGSVERYFVQLSDALGAALHGKPSKAVIAFAGTDVGTTAILHWRLLSRIGAEARADATCADVLAWLLADREALGVFLFSGDPAGGKWGEALRVLAKLAPDAEHRQGRAMRLAIATALVFAEPVKSMADGSAIDPVARVEHFLAWSEGGEFFPSFRELCAWEMRYVVGSWSSDDDLAWARANIKDELRARDKVGDAAYMVPYKDTNARGVSVQEGGKFYDDKPSTLAIMLEYGGVCGAISRFGSSMAQAFGVPAMPVGQPGHCAFIWQREPQRWDIGNDVSGWAGSGCHAGISIPWGAPAWFVPLMQDAQADRERFVDAEMLCAAAELRDARDGLSLIHI
jgi:hypothetical protein